MKLKLNSFSFIKCTSHTKFIHINASVEIMLNFKVTPDLFLETVLHNGETHLNCTIENGLGTINFTWATQNHTLRHDLKDNLMNGSASSTFNYLEIIKGCLFTCEVKGSYIHSSKKSINICKKGKSMKRECSSICNKTLKHRF